MRTAAGGRGRASPLLLLFGSDGVHEAAPGQMEVDIFSAHRNLTVCMWELVVLRPVHVHQYCRPLMLYAIPAGSTRGGDRSAAALLVLLVSSL